MSESDAQMLRTLSEEIARDFAPRLEQTTLVLYDRDPEHLQAQWYVAPQALAEARRLFPGDGTDPRQVLRLCRLGQDGKTEVVASVPQGSSEAKPVNQHGFTLYDDGAEYSCELGLESDAGGWLLLARSNQVRLADRNLPASRTEPIPDDAHAQEAPRATVEQPDESEGIFVEPALAAVGKPLHPVFPNLEPDDAPPEPSAPPAEASDRARSRDRKPESPPGVPLYLMSYRESGDVPPKPSVPPEKAPGRARSEDRGPEFPSGIPHDPAPYPETVTEFPPGVPPEAALAAGGEPLYPVFPNLEPDDAPPGHSALLESALLESALLEKTLGRAWSPDRKPESPSGILQDPVSYPEMATDLPPGAELVDMPPPLLPSSPGLDATADAMPGPLYDPRAALSSAVLSSGIGPSAPDMEIHAELIVQGRAAPGSRVDLFGYPIAVGADGRFYIRHPIDISALEPLAVGGGLLSWLGAVDTHRSRSDCGPFPR